MTRSSIKKTIRRPRRGRWYH